MFSKACEYGIRATIFIAHSSMDGRRVSPKEIAQEIDSPAAFTAKILQALVRHQVVESTKGAHGGFEINLNNIKTIKLSDIVDAIDGDKIYKGCGLGLHECDENRPCPMHDKFKSIRDELRVMLESTDLESLALDLKLGETFLKR
ncbi:RrF2 family transcriptional regulator [Formosa haliotis]|uniref:RrF2 family transcriptional regulator n=1 Tax=Formosa haliotis TaxID=1555194 RepID=UPI00082403F3|nr:Rrf2 family transcriptional regulator [Formosa haliotis]